MMKTPLTCHCCNSDSGASVLGSLLEYHGISFSFEHLQKSCGTMENSGIIETAANCGLTLSPFRGSTSALDILSFPLILYWDFDRFVICDGHDTAKQWYFINDPVYGRYKVCRDDFENHFTGIGLKIEPLKVTFAGKIRRSCFYLKRLFNTVLKNWLLVLPLCICLILLIISLITENIGFDHRFVRGQAKGRSTAVADFPVIKIAVPYYNDEKYPLEFVRSAGVVVDLANRQGGKQIELISRPYSNDCRELASTVQEFCSDPAIAAVWMTIDEQQLFRASALTVSHSLPLVNCCYPVVSEKEAFPDNSAVFYPSLNELISPLLEHLKHRGSKKIFLIIPQNKTGKVFFGKLQEKAKELYPDLSFVPELESFSPEVDAIIFAGEADDFPAWIDRLNNEKISLPLYILSSSLSETFRKSSYSGDCFSVELLVPDMPLEFTDEYIRIYRRTPDNRELLAAHSMRILTEELKKEDYSPEKLSAAMQKRAGDFLSTVLVRIVSVSGKKER
ncbi:MAG: hypothetical protein IKD23_06375 [Lentisphaeria bacterium]|nr:hypothetical protein [Lentisphaeria bacterium]